MRCYKAVEAAVSGETLVANAQMVQQHKKVLRSSSAYSGISLKGKRARSCGKSALCVISNEKELNVPTVQAAFIPAISASLEAALE